MRSIRIIAHDMRSTHNVGALLRTAECLGADAVYLTGYTPYPRIPDDTRLPHIVDKLSRQIDKTALGSAELVHWQHYEDVETLIDTLKNEGFTLAALEQSPQSTRLPDWQPPENIAILLGREVEGVDTMLLKLCDITLEIPQYGQKESLNVIQAAAIALYQCRFG